MHSLYCRNCYNTFTSYNFNAKYCCHSCYMTHRTNKTFITLECFLCGVKFTRKKYLVRGDISFCSKKCSNKHNRSKWTKETARKHSETMKIVAKERGFGKWMLGRSPSNKGAKYPERSGKNHHNWKGGITNIYSKIRQSPEYKKWRIDIFERDNYRCQWCSERGGVLNADHIFPFSKFAKKRFELKNGRTLCFDCHKKRTRVQMSVMWKNKTNM